VRRIAVAVEGGGDPPVRWLAERLAGDDAEIVPDASGADVVMAVGDERLTALDRCRQIARRAPCVVLLPASPEAADLAGAMASGARAVVSLQDDAITVTRAMQAAATFATPAASADRAVGTVVAVTAAHGGAGASTLAVAIAASGPAPVALVDLDVAGGRLADLLGVPTDATEPGLAAQTTGTAAWAELQVDAGWCLLVPSPPRLELAWLVAEGVPAALVAEAALAARLVVADVGRAAGPALEVATCADVIVVACRPGPRSIEAGARHARILRRLAPSAAVRLCVVGAGPRDAARLRLAQVLGGASVDLIVPEPANPARPDGRLRAALAGLVRAA
jgi:CheY-like chemotaxis protein